MPVWIKFNTIGRPYYDRTGKVLTSIDGRTNRQGVDEIIGGGKVYPPICESKSRIKEWYEKGYVLLLLLDISQVYAMAIVEDSEQYTYAASPTDTRPYKGNDFKPIILTDEEAERMKTDVFGIKSQGAESGVTK